MHKIKEIVDAEIFSHISGGYCGCIYNNGNGDIEMLVKASNQGECASLCCGSVADAIFGSQYKNIVYSYNGGIPIRCTVVREFQLTAMPTKMPHNLS
jgi:hypothetical protein